MKDDSNPRQGTKLKYVPCVLTVSRRSKGRTHTARLLDAVRAKLIEKQPCSELDIQPLCTRFKGDSRKALRKVHQCYPGTTRLVIVNGLYVLEPVVA